MAKGKKLCPNCNISTGVRTKVCLTDGCGHIFINSKDNISRGVSFDKNNNTKGKNKIQDTKVIPEIQKPLYNLVFTPAGECPVKLEDTKDNSIREWAGRVLYWGMLRKKYFSLDALSYWLMKEVGAEHKKLDDFVDVLRTIEE